MESADATLSDVIAQYERQGYKGAFAVVPDRPGVLHCQTCDAHVDALRVQLDALHRLEGPSDPSEEVAVLALVCPGCRCGGTVAAAYGPLASREEQAILALLHDDRSSSVVTPGL